MIAPPDYANMPEKKCFAPCPPGMHCDCRERDRAIALREGRLLVNECLQCNDPNCGLYGCMKIKSVKKY